MIRSAPSRWAASTAESPTAPSPTTATTMPGPTPALTAAWLPVHIDVGEREDRAQRLRPNGQSRAP